MVDLDVVVLALNLPTLAVGQRGDRGDVPAGRGALLVFKRASADDAVERDGVLWRGTGVLRDRAGHVESEQAFAPLS